MWKAPVKLLLLACSTHLFASASAAEADDYVIEEGVYVLDETNIEKAIASFDYVLVEFYAPWCGHCQQLEPEYAKAAKILEETKDQRDGKTLILAKLDGSKDEAADLMEKHGVEGFPTIKWFGNGDADMADHFVARTTDEIVSAVNKKIEGPLKLFDGEKEVAAWSSQGRKIVWRFQETPLEDLIDSYAKNAENYEKQGIEFAMVRGATEDSIKYYRAFDKENPFVEFTGEVEANDGEDFAKFINANTFALVTEFSEENQGIFESDIKLHALLLSDSNDDGHAEVHKQLEETAKNFKGQALFIWINSGDEELEGVIDFFGYTKDQLPAVCMMNMGTVTTAQGSEVSNMKFRPESSELTVENLTTFVSSVVKGEAEPYLKSEEIPDADSESEKELKTIVGKNINDIVYQEDKHVFVKFYAPWCGHCQSLAPIWEELAESYKDDDSVVIAESNAVENEFKDVQIEGLPTLILFPKNGAQSQIDYKGERTLEALKKFVDSDGTEITEATTPDYEDDDGEEDYDNDDIDYEDYDDEYDDEDSEHFTDEEEDIAYTDNIKDEL